MPETTADQRGILYPSRLPTFHREPVSEALADRVRWIWIPRWNLPAGQRDRQEVLPFPACNLVVEPDGITLHGPTTSISYRELEGRGWAVGALLTPVGASPLCSPALIRDAHQPVEDSDLYTIVSEAMADPDLEKGRRRARIRRPRPPDCRLPTSPAVFTEPVPTADHQRSSGSQ